MCREGSYIKDKGQFIKLVLAERDLADTTKKLGEPAVRDQRDSVTRRLLK